MIHPAVGSPTTFPRCSVRYPSVKSSASERECWSVTRMVGFSRERWPRTVRAGAEMAAPRYVIVR